MTDALKHVKLMKKRGGQMESLKKQVGYASVNYIKDGMTVGLGTGSTAYYMVEKLGQEIKKGNLNITAVTTSKKTAEQAESLGIPLKDLNEVDWIDVTIDGADEIDPQFQGIKGGGGAHLIEKIVASYSNQVIWIVDESKMVNQLGDFPLPLEVIPFGHQKLEKILQEKGYHPETRLTKEGQLFTTDNDNFIIDLHLKNITDPHALAQELSQLPGIVEHGLFLDMVDIVLVGRNGQVETLKAP